MPQVPTQHYTSRTYQTSMESLKSHLKAKFPDGSWDKLLKQDVPLAMLSALCWMHEQDAFYQDRRWINTYLDLADDRAAAVYLCKQIGYQMRPRSAASAAVRLYPQPTKPVPVVIPKGTAVAYKDTFFTFMEDTTIPAFKAYWPDETSPDVVSVTEGQDRESTFTSDGSDWQEYELPFDNVIQGSLSVEVAGEVWEAVPSLLYVEGTTLGRDTFAGDGLDSQKFVLTLLHAIIDPDNADTLVIMVNGVPWVQVVTFTGAPNEFVAYQTVDGVTTVEFGLASAASAPPAGAVVEALYLISGKQKRYELRYDQNDRPTISFGDDTTGSIPATGVEIKVYYRTGGGVIGNIDIGQLDAPVNGYLNAPPSAGGSETVEVRVYNYSRGTGGNPPEEIDHAKFYAPQWAKANNRAVIRSDWEAIASAFYDPRYGAASHAAAKLHQEVPEQNQVDVSLWSRDSGGRLVNAGESLKAAVKNHLTARRTVCTYVEMVDGWTYYFDVHLAVSLRRGFFTATVFSALQAAVQDFFNSALVMPGRDIRLNTLYQKLNLVDGVYSVTVENISGSVRMQRSQTATGLAQTYIFLFDSPLGQEIVPQSVQIKAGSQTITDDGQGNLIGDINPVQPNSIQYSTGKVQVTFNTVVPGGTAIEAEARFYARLEWSEDRSADMQGLGALDHVTDYGPIIKRPPIGMADGVALDFYLPVYLMPIVPGRLFFLSGYGSTLGGPELWAYDDGTGNIVGDVNPLAVNLIDYRTGRVQMTWNQIPDPVVPAAYVATLAPNADGVVKDFTFSIAGWPGAGLGLGRYILDFSAYPTWGAEAKIYDNAQGQLFGAYLDNRGDSLFNVTAGSGALHFATPPQSPGAPPHTFPFRVQSVTLVLYSAFAFTVKNPLTPGNALYWYADNTGKIWGTTPDSYPTTRLDHLTGHYSGRLSVPVPAAYTVTVAYDAFLQAKAKNIPIISGAIGTFAETIIRQLEEEIDL